MLEKIEGLVGMKILNKKLTLLIMGITILLISLLTGSVQAASQEFGLQEYRKPIGNTQYGYKVSDKYVWKIVTYSGSAINYDKTLYCLKAEQGFFTSEPGKFKETYDLSYDFMNRNSMPTLPVPSQYYNQIVWILNHAYIPNAETATTDKSVLLQNAGITGNHELTDDDIDVVQQLAIWYFTISLFSNFCKYPVKSSLLSPVARRISSFFTGTSSFLLII